MNTIIPAHPPLKGPKDRRVTVDKSGINTKGTNIQVVLRCKGSHSQSMQPQSTTSSQSILEFMEAISQYTTHPEQQESGRSDNHPNNDPTPKPVTDVLLNTNNTIYSFDRVFRPEETQAEVYKDVAEPILNDVLAGYSCTIFAYGQTGTGKTYTMEGDLTEVEGGYGKNAGIIPRTIHNLFEKLPSESHVTVSMLELYNEELRDLLSASDNQKSLRIFEENGSAKVNCQEYHISSVARGIDIMKIGVRKRMTAATNCNEHSSRSHCIFTLNVHTTKQTEKGEAVMSTGKLNLVDLAGSENNRNAGSENMRAREAASINRSLLTLGRVINSLVDKTPHIPYRESKLTRILKDSLGGNTKTCIIATVAPAIQNQEEIRSTLDYASHAKGICNQPRTNNVINRELHLKSLVNTIEQLQDELRINYEKNGVYMTKRNYDQKNADYLELKSKLEAVETSNKTLTALMDGKDKLLEEEKRKRKDEVEEERKRRKKEVEEEKQRRKEDVEEERRLRKEEAQLQRNEYLELLVKYRDEHMDATQKHWKHLLMEAQQKTAKALDNATKSVTSHSSTAAVVPSNATTTTTPNAAPVSLPTVNAVSPLSTATTTTSNSHQASTTTVPPSSNASLHAAGPPILTSKIINSFKTKAARPSSIASSHISTTDTAISSRKIANAYKPTATRPLLDALDANGTPSARKSLNPVKPTSATNRTSSSISPGVADTASTARPSSFSTKAVRPSLAKQTANTVNTQSSKRKLDTDHYSRRNKKPSIPMTSVKSRVYNKRDA
ncbi:P-loop containing nucleoside triphosphate hydrolase protein [Mucor lusitanicus]